MTFDFEGQWKVNHFVNWGKCVLIKVFFREQDDDQEVRKIMKLGDDVIYGCPMRKNAAAVL